MSAFTPWEAWEETKTYQLLEEGYSHEEAEEILNKLEEAREQSPTLFRAMLDQLGW